MLAGFADRIQQSTETDIFHAWKIRFGQLDAIDRSILRTLQQDGRIQNVDLAERVGLSPSPCLTRVRALEKGGYISRYVTLLDSVRVGLRVSVFIQVTLERQIEAALETFERAIRAVT